MSILFCCVFGEREPLALLSMPIRLLRRLTGTALRAVRRVAAGAEGVPLPQFSCITTDRPYACSPARAARMRQTPQVSPEEVG